MDILTTGTIMTDLLAVDLPKIADPGEVIYLDREVEARIGGHPIDVAIDLVKLGFPPQGVGVVAAVGKGLFGDYVKRIIEQHKVQAFLQEVEETDTGKNVVLKKKGEDRRFHIDPGANWYLDPKFVKKVLQEVRPKIFSIRPGYCGIDLSLEEIFEKAKDAFIFLDIMKPHPQRPWDLLLPVLKYADAVHCNEKEATAVTSKQTTEEALRELLGRGAKIIFLSRGGRGAEIIAEGFRISQPAFAIEAIDPTGAGDAFCAGIIYKMIEWGKYRNLDKLPQDKLVEMLMFAQAVGASAAVGVGCTEGVSKEKVDALIKEQKERIISETKVRQS